MEAAKKVFGLRTGADIRVLSQPDAVAAAQYFDGLKRQAPFDPEAELALAVLEDAVICLRKYRSARSEKERRLYRETEEWVFEDDRQWIFSFLNVCDFLGLDPGYLRRGLRQETSDHSAVKRSAA